MTLGILCFLNPLQEERKALPPRVFASNDTALRRDLKSVTNHVNEYICLTHRLTNANLVS